MRNVYNTDSITHLFNLERNLKNLSKYDTFYFKVISILSIISYFLTRH